MQDDTAVSIKSVSKDFRLPSEKYSSLKSHVLHPFKRRTFKYQHALKDINLDIKKGEFFGIVGRNGSGKSTLLKMIAGIYQPTKGKVLVAGKLVPFIELGVGFNPELTGQENVYLNGALLGFSEKEIDSMYDDIVAFAELGQFMGQKLKNYSSGMQVRLAFSMAVRAKADVLLIDEVLAVGDADFQRKCFEYFKKLKKEKTTVIFVSHDMDAVREYCDRAMLIEKSEVVEVGTTGSVAEKYLKLFTEKADIGEQEQGEGARWGDGSIQIRNIEVEVTTSRIVIKQSLIANKEILNPIVGFRIRDAAGKDVAGTNTKIEKCVLGKLSEGQKFELMWEVPNFLSDGRYHIDPAVLHGDGITVSDWWDGARLFIVKKQRRVPYALDPGFKITVSGN